MCNQSCFILAGQAGAMDEDQFMSLFEDVPQVQLFSSRELEEHLIQIKDTISDQTKDWNKRVDAVSFSCACLEIYD